MLRFSHENYILSNRSYICRCVPDFINPSSSRYDPVAWTTEVGVDMAEQLLFGIIENKKTDIRQYLDTLMCLFKENHDLQKDRK